MRTKEEEERHSTWLKQSLGLNEEELQAVSSQLMRAKNPQKELRAILKKQKLAPQNLFQIWERLDHTAFMESTYASDAFRASDPVGLQDSREVLVVSLFALNGSLFQQNAQRLMSIQGLIGNLDVPELKAAIEYASSRS